VVQEVLYQGRHSGTQTGTKLQMESTIEAQRMKTTATVVPLPFFNPKRKIAVLV
jgi:hypothetical protein